MAKGWSGHTLKGLFTVLTKELLENGLISTFLVYARVGQKFYLKLAAFHCINVYVYMNSKLS